MRVRRSRLLAWSLFVVAIAVYAWNILDVALRPPLATMPGLTSNTLAWLLAYVSFAVVGVVIATRRPEHPIGWLFLAVGIVNAPVNAGPQYAADAALRGDSLPASHLVAWLALWTWVWGMALVVLAMLYFPDGRLPSRRWRVVVVVCGLAALVISVANAIDLWSVPTRLLARQDASALRDHVSLHIVGAVYPVVLLCALAAIASLVVRFRRSGDVERRQLKWLVLVAVVSGVGLIVNKLPGVGPTRVGQLADFVSVPFAVPVAVGLAVLRYRLYDIDRIVSRTVSYAAVTGVLVGVYVGSVVLTTRLLPFSSSFGVAASTLVAAALFRPVRRRVQDLVDRRFNRAGYDSTRTVQAFAGELREQVHVDAVSGRLVATVSGSLQPASVSLWLRATP